MVRCRYGCSLGNSVFFSSYITGLVPRYPELFEGGGSSSQYEINFGKKWKGYSGIYELAEGRIERLDEVIKEPLEKCLLFLSFKADKNMLEGLMHKEMMKRNS
jgi:hypothetical protein